MLDQYIIKSDGNNKEVQIYLNELTKPPVLVFQTIASGLECHIMIPDKLSAKLDIS